ncbi:hypothetical protein BC831DRAFT_483787 [Entophlyctis helioformis]|nr:hypothetical protein BC831DRAFT_483787 [Entophlyctis helioformis]
MPVDMHRPLTFTETEFGFDDDEYDPMFYPRPNPMHPQSRPSSTASSHSGTAQRAPVSASIQSLLRSEARAGSIAAGDSQATGTEYYTAPESFVTGSSNPSRDVFFTPASHIVGDMSIPVSQQSKDTFYTAPEGGASMSVSSQQPYPRTNQRYSAALSMADDASQYHSAVESLSRPGSFRTGSPVSFPPNSPQYTHSYPYSYPYSPQPAYQPQPVYPQGSAAATAGSPPSGSVSPPRERDQRMSRAESLRRGNARSPMPASRLSSDSWAARMDS